MNANYVKLIKASTLSAVLNTALSWNALANTSPITVESKPVSVQENISLIAVAKNTLRTKLASLAFFSADFTQVVESTSGEKIAQSTGKLAISKPNLANWHTLTPDELAIISDGNDVWFYDPWIEQVSVYSLSAAIAKTPILLLTSQDESLWEQYSVTKLSDDDLTTERFVISANDVNSQIKSLTLMFDTVSDHSQLKQFSFLDATGQLSHIRLTNFEDKNPPNLSLFRFEIPEGVQVDDQRSN